MKQLKVESLKRLKTFINILIMRSRKNKSVQITNIKKKKIL